MLSEMFWLCQYCLISIQSLVILNRFRMKKENQMFVTLQQRLLSYGLL